VHSRDAQRRVICKKNWALSAVLYSERSVFGAYDGLHLRTAICYGSFVSANIVEMIEDSRVLELISSATSSKLPRFLAVEWLQLLSCHDG
jgi:hypothetical protein